MSENSFIPYRSGAGSIFATAARNLPVTMSEMIEAEFLLARTAKSCPFCGCTTCYVEKIEAAIFATGSINANDKHYVTCPLCISSGPIETTEIKAIAAWNAALRKAES